jgi:hypothetical protein
MCDRKYRNVTHQANEYDVIREIVNRKASHISICNTRNECPRLGELLEVQKCLPDLSGESLRYLAAPFSVPGRSFA